jgi:hypothetical protein
MNPLLRKILPLALVAACSVAVAPAAVIVNVVETGGDNEVTDTITAKWTGQTFNVSITNEPFTGAVIGNPFTVPAFGNQVPTFVDRNHRYQDDPGTGGGNPLAIPSYLLGLEYIMSGNDNRDNASYILDVTVSAPTRVYMLIDNRLGDPNSLNSDPPSFGPTKMQWILDEAWQATANGLNRFGNVGVPDEVPIDEGEDGTINQWYSVYYKDYAPGTFQLRQADNAGQNMYGAILQQIPEPTALSLAALGVLGILRRRR